MHETSDFWVDSLKLWWQLVRDQFKHIRTLVIYLDNGPNNSGTRTQFLKRLVEFADWSGLTLRLVYYPPYHSKYNPIERCWSALEKKWNGVLLATLQIVLECACECAGKKGIRRSSTWRALIPTGFASPAAPPKGNSNPG